MRDRNPMACYGSGCKRDATRSAHGEHSSAESNRAPTAFCLVALLVVSGSI
jgi:hypothetical protein